MKKKVNTIAAVIFGLCMFAILATFITFVFIAAHNPDAQLPDWFPPFMIITSTMSLASMSVFYATGD